MCVSRTSSFTEMAGEFDLKDRHRAVAANSTKSRSLQAEVGLA